MSILRAIIMAAVVTVASPAFAISNDEFDRLVQLEQVHCFFGTYSGHPNQKKILAAKGKVCAKHRRPVDVIRRRCALRLSENNYACSSLIASYLVYRYPPPDPRKTR